MFVLGGAHNDMVEAKDYRDRASRSAPKPGRAWSGNTPSPRRWPPNLPPSASGASVTGRLARLQPYAEAVSSPQEAGPHRRHHRAVGPGLRRLRRVQVVDRPQFVELLLPVDVEFFEFAGTCAWRFRVLPRFSGEMTPSTRLVSVRRGRGCFVFRYWADSGEGDGTPRRAGVEDDRVDPRLGIRLILRTISLDPSSLDHTRLEDRKGLFDRVQLDQAPCTLVLVVNPIQLLPIQLISLMFRSQFSRGGTV